MKFLPVAILCSTIGVLGVIAWSLQQQPLRQIERPPTMGVDKGPIPAPQAAAQSFEPRMVIQAVVTLVMGVAALFVILSKRYSPKDKHWAYTTVGALLGFWLRT